MSAMLDRLDKLAQALCSVRLSRALLMHGVLGGAEHRSMFPPELRTVVDIGANKGQFSLAARRWAPRARVIAFEPLDEPASAFRRVFSGDDRVVLHQAAIGPSTAMQLMHVSAREDSSSLLPISAAQTEMFPGTGEKATVTVRVARLGEFLDAGDLPAPALLKLDVQGYEYEALRGCESLLDCFDYVYCECSYVELYTGQKLVGEVSGWLEERGFTLEATFNPAYDRLGRAVQADLLFRREKRAA